MALTSSQTHNDDARLDTMASNLFHRVCLRSEDWCSNHGAQAHPIVEKQNNPVHWACRNTSDEAYNLICKTLRQAQGAIYFSIPYPFNSI